MRVQLEFLGLSRLATGLKTSSLELEEGATFNDLVRVLAASYPDLIGNVIQSDGETLQPPNVFNLNTRQMIQETTMGTSPKDGDLIILSQSVPAQDTATAVVQIKNQIGVTCKIYRRQGDEVHLIASNENYGPRIVRHDQIEWALAVLWRVRV